LNTVNEGVEVTAYYEYNIIILEKTSWNVATHCSDATLYTLTVDDVANATVRASGDNAIIVGPLQLYCQVFNKYGSWLFVYSTETIYHT